MAVRLTVFHSDGTSEVMECSGIPNDTFKPLVEEGSDWEINLLHADKDEDRTWRQAHMSWRVALAFKNGKPVKNNSGKPFATQQEFSSLFVRSKPGSVHFSETNEAVYISVIHH
jgi:hypothetical protein